jgi:hypothetical protein
MTNRSVSRRRALAMGAGLAGAAWAQPPQVPEFDVSRYGAAGDGVTLDSPAIQRAIDAAAATGRRARVLVRGGRRYLVGTLELRPNIEFHLADDAELLVSTRKEDYSGLAVLRAHEAHDVQITGTGNINGRSLEFLTQYDKQDEWYLPVDWRPRIFELTACKGLEVRGISFSDAPFWGLHMIGCEGVLVDGLRVRNRLDVPNCDGIDPDHCRDVEIRNCHIVCGDDAIVLKATRQPVDYGPCANIRVHDCVLETQDAGVKIGTETAGDIRDVRFERCAIRTSSRGLCIQLRDEGSVYNIDFREISFVSRYHSDPWWGRGEAISFTAIPRNAQTRLGAIHDIRVTNVSGRAENSVRIQGSEASRIRGVTFENFALTLDRWTSYRGGVFDNRPTTVLKDIEPHGAPGFSIRHADNVVLKNSSVAWGPNRPDYFTHALEAESVHDLELWQFSGESAHPARDAAIVIR